VTWTKISDDFPEEAARAGLTDSAFRTHVEAMVWTMRRETGGNLTPQDLRRALESPFADDAVDELLARGWWVRDGTGYRLVVGMEHQPEPEVLAQRRKKTADRVRRHRLKEAGIDPDTGELVPEKKPRDASRNASRNAVTERVTRDGTGRDGPERNGWL
jgi:hypothetical protein